MQNQQQSHRRQPDLSGRIIYADPRSLPSYPSAGLKDDSTAASIAAAIGWKTQLKAPSDGAASPSPTAGSRPPSRPSSTPANADSLRAATTAASAAAAALYQRPSSASPDPPPVPVPTIVEPPASSDVGSTAGSSMAAATAAIGSATSRHRRTTSSDSAVLPSAKPSAWGNSAANYAFKNNSNNNNGDNSKNNGVSPVRSTTGKEPSLHAAKGAMKVAPQQQMARAISSPGTARHRKSYSSHYPDSTATMTPAVAANTSSANALSAATAASDRFSIVGEAGAVPYTKMDRQMFTATPPVALETEDKKHNDLLQASAVAMARRMYNPTAEKSGTAAAPFTSKLQEEAYRLAQVRLEKVNKEHQKNRDYRDHYVDPKLASSTDGADSDGRSSTTMASRFAVRSRLQRRRRSSSDSEVVPERASEQRQASMEMRSAAEVDYDKRRRDRQSVLAAAQRNVRAQLHDIDEQVYANTGKVRPSLRATWEHKAAKTAQARSEARLEAQPLASEVDLGGGRFMARAEVDRIAAARVQPLLDKINDKAEQERERQAALKQDEQDRKDEVLELKARDKEMKETYARLKREDKEAKKEKRAGGGGEDDTEDGDNDNDAEVMTAATGDGRQSATSVSSQVSPSSPTSPRRLSRLFARTSKLQSRKAVAGEVPVTTAAPAALAEPAVVRPAEVSRLQTEVPGAVGEDQAPEEVPPQSPQSPQSDASSSGNPKARVKNWIKSRFARPRAKSSVSATSATDGSPSTERSFIGGHTLTQSDAAATAAVHPTGSPVTPAPVHTPPLQVAIPAAIPADSSSLTTLADRPTTTTTTTGGTDDGIPTVATPEAGTSGSLWATGTIGAIGAIGTVGTVGTVGAVGTAAAVDLPGQAEKGEKAEVAEKVGKADADVLPGTFPQERQSTSDGGSQAAEKTTAGENSLAAETHLASGNRASWDSHGGSSSIYSAAATDKTDGGERLHPLVLTAEPGEDNKAVEGVDGDVSPRTIPRNMRNLAANKSVSPVRDSRFLEDLHKSA